MFSTASFTAKRIRLMLLPIFACLFAATSAAAQTNKPPAAPDQQNLIEVLIQEVRQLRLTMERHNVTAFRAQIAVERMRAQHDIITRLNRDLDGVRQEIASLKAQTAQFNESLQETEKKVDAGTISDEQLKEVKWMVENMKAREQTLRERETALTNQLNTENAKMYELNQRLDMLEQVLESVQNLDAPKTKKKN